MHSSKDEAQGVLRLELVPTSIDHVAVTDPKMVSLLNPPFWNLL